MAALKGNFLCKSCPNLVASSACNLASFLFIFFTGGAFSAALALLSVLTAPSFPASPPPTSTTFTMALRFFSFSSARRASRDFFFSTIPALQQRFTRTGLPSMTLPANFKASSTESLLAKVTYPIPLPRLVTRSLISRTLVTWPTCPKNLQTGSSSISMDKLPMKTDFLVFILVLCSSPGPAKSTRK